MAPITTTNRASDFTVRALQLLFAVIVMGTDGYAIHSFVPSTTYTNLGFGSYYLTTNVAAWGFLMFCACFTPAAVIVLFIATTRFPNNQRSADYIRIAIDALAFLSWFAGWIAVAVDLATNSCTTACPAGKNCCGALTAAAIFAAFEWLLFAFTMKSTVMNVWNSIRLPRTPSSPTNPTRDMNMAS